MSAKSIAKSLVLLLLSPLALAQTIGCAQFNTTFGPFYMGHYAINDHYTGNHSSAFSATGSCTYVNPPSTPCNVTAQANEPSPGIADTGVRQTIGYHVGRTAVESGAASATYGQGATASAIGAVAFEHCLFQGCAFSIGITGTGTTGYNVTFPPGAIWDDKFPYNVSCAGRVAPPSNTGCGSQCGPTPVILDTGNTGFMHGMSDPKTACILFDIEANGSPVCVSWPTSGSGLAWLVLPDKHHAVTSGKQLFGNHTPQENHPNPKPNGFLALAEYDGPDKGGNYDLVIDKQDKVWRRLRLWIDSHCQLTPSVPCVAHPSDLHMLDEFGIQNIGLVYAASPLVDGWGNRFELYTHVNVKPDKLQDADIDSRLAYDVWLVANGGKPNN